MRLPQGALALGLGFSSLASAFYLPGVAPADYKHGEQVPLYVNRLTPARSLEGPQLRSLVSYDYYDSRLGFCKPEGGPKAVSESLGSILFGDRIQTSPFEIFMGKNETCKTLCTIKYPKKRAKWINKRIRQNYNMNWLIDGLPAGMRASGDDDASEVYLPGFPLGWLRIEEDGQSGETKDLFNNHYDITIDYHEVKRGGKSWYRVVGVAVDPDSSIVKKDLPKNAEPRSQCAGNEPVMLSTEGATEVTFTYTVAWRPSKTAWATRWDRYLHVFDPKIHWFSLVNSTIIVVFLTGMVGTVLMRALRQDIARYNQLDLDEDVQDDSGWKLVHGDVFRAPKNPMLLSIFLGSGAQLFFMTGVTIAFALLGFLSPSNRGSLGTVMIILHTLFGFVGGYVSARAYKTLGGEAWKRNIAFTPTLIPGIVFGTFFFLNLFLFFENSSGAVPFGTMLALVSIWFIISVPLSFAGSWVGFRVPALEPPVRTNQIPRQIPPQATYMRTVPSMLMAGILPFGAIFVELYFIMNSIWFHKVYYMFGFLFLCYGIMIITCATVTILMVYFILCSENYHWQWRAFFTAGASAIYIFLNAIYFWIRQLSLGGLTSNVLYLGYSALVGFLFFILTGTIGFFSAYFFVRRIYSSIKIE